MALSLPPSTRSLPRSLARPPTRFLTRRSFLKAGIGGVAGLALYSGEIARHNLDIVERDVSLRGLSPHFDGMRIAQISDIHMDNFAEPFFLRHVVDRVNRLKPDMVCLTGDFVTSTDSPSPRMKKFAIDAAWQCANILTGLESKALYAVLGNHDYGIGAQSVSYALTASGITVLRDNYLPIQRGSARFWLAGLNDPTAGHPRPALAVPPSIRNIPNEPVLLMCHAPDYADFLLTRPEGQAVSLMLSGHTHGGQIRLPLLGAMVLPTMGRKYIHGLFQLGSMQLYVNRGIGAIGLPFRLNCPPEITLLTLRASA
jgi:predicted MPP superfamily phosphohydrolase